MKTPVLLIAAALALAADFQAARGEEGGSTRLSPVDLEERFYRVFYAESATSTRPRWRSPPTSRPPAPPIARTSR